MIKKLNILGSEFKIELVKHPGIHDDGKKNDWGYSHWAEGLIQISSQITNNCFMKNTLIHEILHMFGVQLALQKKLDEDTVDRLATAFQDLMVNNPEFVKMWLK